MGDSNTQSTSASHACRKNPPDKFQETFSKKELENMEVIGKTTALYRQF